MNKQEMIETIYALTMGSLYKDTWKYDLCLIGDVLDFVAEHDKTIPYWLSEEETEIVILRTNKREPIENQSEECIKFIYDLIAQQ